MKSVLLLFGLFTASGWCVGQYYYKDIVSPAQLGQKFRAYHDQKVKSVEFVSFDAGNAPIDGFSGEQSVTDNFSSVFTSIKDPLSGTSESNALINSNGQLVKTVDTADGVRNVTEYEYDAQNRVKVVTTTASSPGGFNLREQHRWMYGPDGRPEHIIKIKNGVDTTHINLIPDEKGNIAEERSTHAGRDLPTVYYYYDSRNNLTDIVRFNEKARRLLPDYVFEYDEKNRVSTMLVVPEGSGDYQKWYYSYDDNGLKKMDACYSKTKALIARIEYHYHF